MSCFSRFGELVSSEWRKHRSHAPAASPAPAASASNGQIEGEDTELIFHHACKLVARALCPTEMPRATAQVAFAHFAFDHEDSLRSASSSFRGSLPHLSFPKIPSARGSPRQVESSHDCGRCSERDPVRAPRSRRTRCYSYGDGGDRCYCGRDTQLGPRPSS